MEQIVIYSLTVMELLNSKQKNLRFIYAQERSADNMKRTGFNDYVYDFSVDYATAVDILDIHRYLMKKMI